MGDFANEILECDERNSLWAMRRDELQFILWKVHQLLMMGNLKRNSEVDESCVVVEE